MIRRPRRGKPISNRELAENLCAVSAALGEERQSHVNSFGTLIPHVFMANVLARVGACLRANATGEQGEEAAGILMALERGMEDGDRETRNVISLSFASDAELESFFGVLTPMLGPRIRALLPGL